MEKRIAGLDDSSDVNLGQLHWIASGAFYELSRLPDGLGNMRPADPNSADPKVRKGGIGWRLQQLVRGFNDDDDKAPVRYRELEAIAQPFYERLVEAGYYPEYLWKSRKSRVRLDHVNLAQVRAFFRFDLDADNDGDGILNLEELFLSTNLNVADDPELLPAPVHLYGRTEGNRGVQLYWNSGGESAPGFYLIERWGPRLNLDFRVIKVPSTQTTWIDKNLGAGTTHHYRVRLFVNGRVSAPAHTISWSFWSDPAYPKDGVDPDGAGEGYLGGDVINHVEVGEAVVAPAKKP